MPKKLLYPPFSAIIIAVLLGFLAGSAFLLNVVSQEKSFWQSKYEGIVQSILNPAVLDEGGSVGEEEGEARVAQTIFNTSGAVKEISQNYILVLGLGDNFADKEARELRVAVAQDTVISDGANDRREVGPDGLAILQVGDRVTLESSQNIRGRTEFTAKYINVIY